MKWFGRCGHCRQNRDLALEPGANRRICIDCYMRLRENPRTWCTFVTTHPAMETWAFKWPDDR